MSWLHSLTGVLSEDEISKLKELRLIGKEKEVLDLVLSFTKGEAPTPDEICEHARISGSHYYKINSVLLDKLFLHYVPAGEYELLQWLRKKELYALLKNETKAQLKQKHSIDYFLNTFRLLIDLPYKFYDEKLTKETGNAYLNSLVPCEESDRMYVSFHLLFADCNRYAAGKNPAKQFHYSAGDLQQMEKDLKGKKYYLAQYYLYRTLCNYYNYYHRDSALSLDYLQKAMQLKDKIAGFFPINIHQFLRLLYADALLAFNEVERSFALYKEVFDEGINEGMYGYYYHCEQYSIAAILLKKYDKAERLLQNYFDPCLERENDIYATRGALAYAKLYLSNGEYKKAQSYIKSGIRINEKSFYLPFEIQLRALENIYFFLQNDYDFAKQLAQRNAKFISNQKAEELTKNYRNFFKIIAAFIQCIEQKKAFPIALQQEYKATERNFRTIYCDLIPLIYAKSMKHRD